MPNYRRHRVPGGTYFFTVNLQNRKARLLTDAIDSLRDAVRHTKLRRPYHIDAFVVLPDHLHAVWTLPPGDDDYSGRWRAIKTRFTKALTHSHEVLVGNVSIREIWQPRFWAHTVMDERDYAAHVDYVHINPLKHGHVTRIRDWPYSTFHRYVQDGVYAESWGDDPDQISAHVVTDAGERHGG